MLRQNAGYTRIRVSGYRDQKAKARRRGAAPLPLPSWHLHLQLKPEGASGDKAGQGVSRDQHVGVLVPSLPHLQALKAFLL